MGFLMDAERRTLPGAAARSHVKLATGPLELAKRCGSQPALRHLTAVCIIRPTAQPTTRSHTSLHPGSHQPPVTAVSGATRKMPSHVQHGFTPPPPTLHKFQFRILVFSISVLLGKRSDKRSQKAEKCNEILNLRAITGGWRGGAEVQQFVTISDRTSWPLQLKQ